MRNDPMLNIADYVRSSKALGPGNRFVLWVQGCQFNCYNCISPNYKEFGKGKDILVSKLCDYIVNTENIDGVTISGGEPIDQIVGVSELVNKINLKRPELNIIIFTGYNHKDLIVSNKIQLLKNVDVLICGIYIHALNDGIGIRGSNNQEIVFNTDRMVHNKDLFYNSDRVLEISVNDNEINIVGIPDKKFLN